jgi:hypothetical protein
MPLDPLPPDLAELEAGLAHRAGPAPPAGLRDRLLAAVAAELPAPAAPHRPRGRWDIVWRVAAGIALMLNLGMAVMNGVRFERWAALPDDGLAISWRPPLDSLDATDPLQRAAAGALADLKPAPDIGRLGRSIFDYRDEENPRWATP